MSTAQGLAAASSSAITLSVPYYSGFPLFCRTLQSIAAQSHPHCRVLVVDDSPRGLSPGEHSQVSLIIGRAFPLRIVRNDENLGMARTWNRCLDEAETDLVSIVHGDDELAPNYADKMVALAGQHASAAAVFCGASIIGDDGRSKLSVPDLYKLLLIPRHARVLELSGDAALHSLLRGNYIFCPTLCYRRSRLGPVRFDPRYRMVLDLDLTTRLLLSGERIVGVPKQALYRYRRHDENATEHLTKELTRFHEESAFYLDIAQRARTLGYTRSEKTGQRRGVIKLNLVFCILRDVLARQWQDGARKLSLWRELFTAGRVP